MSLPSENNVDIQKQSWLILGATDDGDGKKAFQSQTFGVHSYWQKISPKISEKLF